MASIWKQNREVTNDVKRNNFDLSKQAHDTFKFGYLYPVYCQRVYPTDSFRIRTAFDLKMMPLMFPLQSRVRAHMHYFYVRNKNLWSGWEDFISGLKSPSAHPHPYILPDDNDVQTGGIHDFLGVPTTVITKSSVTKRFMFSSDGISLNPVSDLDPSQGSKVMYTPYRLAADIQTGALSDALDDDGINYGFSFDFIGTEVPFNLDSVFKFNFGINHVPNQVKIGVLYTSTDIRIIDVDNLLTLTAASDGWHFDDSQVYTFEAFKEMYSSVAASEGFNPCLLFFYKSVDVVQDKFQVGTQAYPTEAGQDMPIEWNDTGVRAIVSQSAGYYQYSGLGLNYYRDNQPLNALPYRAYQSIYYGYYANDILQPLVINGEKEYNKFVENDGDGLDSTDYHLYRRNYELDFLTSCMPSPQAGPAPLVGISALGDITISDANGVSTGNAEIAPDGTITKIVATSPLASVEHGRTMMNIAALGFNINDLRSANALQRLAEQTLRSGYRYINWVKGQYGRSPEYRELDMPEFIGGFSRDIQIGTVVSQADTAVGGSGKNLGDYGANGRVIGGSQHDITHYCDDYGWIIGIMCITPTPAYSQLLPKQMIAPTNPLDYANPFMNQIGMQPVTYREVCPLQAYIDSQNDQTKSVDDTFGYQRPNYDEVGAVDEVHGEFRASLKDYLINRQFDGRPELGTDFLEVNPSEINDIFVDQNPDDDVFVGNLAFNVSAKRPFPRVHMPGLGR